MLKKGELVFVKAGEHIPADGEVVEGAASVDESAITGESAPVIREAGGDRSAVTGGTTVLSDWLVIRVTSEAGESFLDKMIAMVEGAARKKTPNEIALQIFLVALSVIFILVTVSLYTYSVFSAKLAGIENPTSVTTLVALLVCLAPTTIGALLSAIGIAGMSRLNQANVLAMSGRAIEAAGDVDILMLDKTGTITLGNRQASEFIPVDGVDIRELADAAQLSSLADETPEGRSVVVLAKEQFGLRGRSLQDKGMQFIPFTAVTRMSGVDFDGNEIRKGAADTMQTYVARAGGKYSEECDRVVMSIASKGGTPLVVAKNHRILGVIYLKDIIKQGVKEKFADLRKMGIKTIMITGDNPITAAAIAAEAGVDDFLAEATPEGKLAMIRMYAAPSNLSPASEEYETLVAERVEKLRAANPEMAGIPIPVDLVTCSGSGLDPHISPAAAEYQVARIARAKNVTEDEVRRIIKKCTDGRFPGVFGEETVNVLKVNLMLDGILEES